MKKHGARTGEIYRQAVTKRLRQLAAKKHRKRR
jgi:hypothetical protein